MSDLFELCRAAVTAAAAIDLSALEAPELRTTAVGLQQHIDQMGVALAKVLHEAEVRGAWQGTGARSMADWLAGKTKSSYGQAKKKEKLGEAMGKSKELDEAVKKGDLSPDAASELSDAVNNPPEGADVGELVKAAKGATPKEAKDAAETWKRINSSESEEDAEKRRFAQRSVKSGLPNDGMVTTIATLPVLENRTLHNALEHIMGMSQSDGRTREQQRADALTALVDAYAKGTVTGGREQPSIIATCPIGTLTGASDEPGVTPHGDRIPAHVMRQLAENATLQRMLIDAEGILLDLGRETRFATLNQYKALVAIDGCCTVVTCSIPAGWCDVDHFVAWEDGGETNLDDLRLLCRFHHKLRHAKGSWVSGTARDGAIHLADGTVLRCKSKGTAAAAKGRKRSSERADASESASTGMGGSASATTSQSAGATANGSTGTSGGKGAGPRTQAAA
jgi:hypothetical protein